MKNGKIIKSKDAKNILKKRGQGGREKTELGKEISDFCYTPVKYILLFGEKKKRKKEKIKKKDLDLSTYIRALEDHYICRHSVSPSTLTAHPHTPYNISLEMSPSFITSDI